MLAGFGSPISQELVLLLAGENSELRSEGCRVSKISQTLPESDESVDVKESMGDDNRKCAA